MISGTFYIKPFSVLHQNSTTWRKRRKEWAQTGLVDTIGREDIFSHYFQPLSSSDDSDYVSAFDPVLAECAYRWFGKEGGSVLDPFCGGATRGFVASALGMQYTGIDIRQEQIDANTAQCKRFGNPPKYICADSFDAVRGLGMYDLVFSCPPYYDLEVYSDNPDDLSNMKTYGAFLEKYKSIIRKCCRHLNVGCYAVFVVGEIRDRNGYCRGFVKDTIDAFIESGLHLWNEIIIEQPNEAACARVGSFASTKKAVKIHQNMLVFAKDVIENVRIEKQIEKFASKISGDKEKLMRAYAKMKK